MTTECTEVQQSSAALLDGELSPDRRDAAEAHLHTCPACAATLERDRQFRSFLRRRLDVAPTPGDVRARLMAAIETESRRMAAPARPAWWQGLVTPWLRPAYRLALATVAVAAVAAFVWPGRDVQTAIPLAEVAIQYARASAGTLPLDVETASVDTLKAFYRSTGLFDFDETAEDFAGMGFRLIGGTVLRLGGRPVTASVYEGPGGRMLCHRFRADGIRDPDGGKLVGKHRFYRVEGMTIGVVRLGAVVCILVTGMPADEFIKLVTAA